MPSFTPDGQMQSTWHIRVGSTFRKNYIWSTGSPAVPVDLTGWTAKAHIRLKETDALPVIELTTENGGITLGSDGSIAVEIGYEAAGTPLLSGQKKAVFDMELTSADLSYRRNLIGGPVVVYGERTKP